MGLLGRFFSERDLKFIASINGELMGDIIQTEVFIYKICPEQTVINIYGESSPQSGKSFVAGLNAPARLISRYRYYV